MKLQTPAEIKAEETINVLKGDESLKKEVCDLFESVSCVRTHAYMLPFWTIIINFSMGIGAIVFLILSAINSLGAQLLRVSLIISIVLIAGVLVFTLILKVRGPSTINHYMYKKDGTMYTFGFINKYQQYFSDGVNNIESDRQFVRRHKKPMYFQYSINFIPLMEVYSKEEKPLKQDTLTIYKGAMLYDDKRYKCRLRLKNGGLYLADVGGARLKFFDVNNEQEKYTVTEALREAVHAAKVDWPKIPSVRTPKSGEKVEQ